MTRTATAILALMATAGTALAETAAPEFGAGAAPPSPFAWARDGGKAAHLAKTAGSAGAKVIGGTEAGEGAWPWQVALMLNGRPVSPDGQFCGGTMLLDTWVLTAAHCVRDRDAQGQPFVIDPNSISVLVGTNTLAPAAGDLVGVAAIYPHPDYRDDIYDNDIALIRLTRAPQVPYATITVPDAEFGDRLDQPGVTTIVTGWGLTEGGTHPDRMHQTEIQMLDRSQCNNFMLESRAEAAAQSFGQAVGVLGVKEEDAYALWDELMARTPVPISENMLCSGTYEGGKTACSGDSGGPLVVPLEDGSYVQAGVVSWGLSGANGRGCEERAFFSAYTRVSNYLGWLEQTIAEAK